MPIALKEAKVLKLMTPERWQQIEKIFNAVMERPPKERKAFLARVCKGDNDLKNEVETLVLAEASAGAFLHSAVEQAAQHLLAPNSKSEVKLQERIGNYRLLQEIGRGGMGLVYLAVRDDGQFKQRVAIKLIRREMNTADILRRFRSERQILAALDHPNIARLLDGGATDDGTPYFVMEYVEGKPLLEYCEQHQLSTEKRLELFRQICSAVAYAHQNLIVHRDLKPSNILITPDGTPKLLDFGIAKPLNPVLLDNSEAPTKTGAQMMTLEYAAPEQARGEKVTTAADIYSLGVILYELLTGHRPFRVENKPPLEVLRLICEEEPLLPSAALSAECRMRSAESKNNSRSTNGKSTKSIRQKTTPHSAFCTPHSLKGDLDNILLKALRKAPQRRYSSVEQFSEDIRRHLAGLPVIARPDTFTYRAGKFIQRQRIAVTAGLLILLTLLAGVVATLWQAQQANLQRREAEQRFNDVRKLANSLIYQLHEEIVDLPGSTKARQSLVKMALEYLDPLAQKARGDVTLQLELAAAYEKVGDLQGHPFRANIGDTSGALTSYQKALAIRQKLVGKTGDENKLQHELAVNRIRIADILEVTGKKNEALENYRIALQSLETLAAENPKDANLQEHLSVAYERMGDQMADAENFAEALKYHRQSLAVGETLVANHPEKKEFRPHSIISRYKIAAINLELNQPTEAIMNLREAIAGYERLIAEDPNNARYKRELTVFYELFGISLAKAGNVAEGVQMVRNSLSSTLEMLRADPLNALLRGDVAGSYSRLGEVLVIAKKFDEAAESYAEAAQIGEKLIAADPNNKSLIRGVAVIYRDAGDLQTKLADDTEARKNYLRALELAENLLSDGAADTKLRLGMADVYAKLGENYLRQSEKSVEQKFELRREAKSFYQKSLAMLLELQNQGILPESATPQIESIKMRIVEMYSTPKK